MPTTCHRCAIVALALLCLLALVSCAAPQPTRDPRIDIAIALQEARTAGDAERAREFVNDDPRMWYNAREGEGIPLTLTTAEGSYAEWDREFRSEGEILEWEVGPDWVAAIHSEMNDYFRLLERTGSWYKRTWFFDEQGRITGSMISGWEGAPPTTDRFDEFETWAQSNHPEEWDYLRPGGRLDPTGDRAARTRVLLVAWRREVGLPSID